MAWFFSGGGVPSDVYQFDGENAAPKVGTDKARYDFVLDGHSGADNATFACVTVRHDSNLGVLKEVQMVNHIHDLSDGLVIDIVCKDGGIGIFAVKSEHRLSRSFYCKMIFNPLTIVSSM